MTKKYILKSRYKIIFIIICFLIVFLYFFVFRAWYRPMSFDVSLFEKFVKCVDECDDLDALYNKLNKFISLDEAEYEYDFSLENAEILLFNCDYDSNGPINATWGEIIEKTNDVNLSSFFFDDVNSFEGVYTEFKNKYGVYDPFYKLLVYNYSSENFCVFLTPLTKNRDHLFQKSNPIVALYLETSKYIFVLCFDFEWAYPEKAEKYIETIFEQLLEIRTGEG